MSSIKTDQAFLLFTIITSLKYKFVLRLLKEDGCNRSVSVYNNIMKSFSSYYYEIYVCTVEVVVSNQTELEPEGKVVKQLSSDSVSENVFSSSEIFLYLTFISFTYVA